jgi:hypothetical protein
MDWNITPALDAGFVQIDSAPSVDSGRPVSSMPIAAIAADVADVADRESDVVDACLVALTEAFGALGLGEELQEINTRVRRIQIAPLQRWMGRTLMDVDRFFQVGTVTSSLSVNGETRSLPHRGGRPLGTSRGARVKPRTSSRLRCDLLSPCVFSMHQVGLTCR